MPPVQPDPENSRDPIAAPLGTEPAPVDPEGPDSYPPPPPGPLRWKTNLVLFVATVLSVFLVGAGYQAGYDNSLPEGAGGRDLLLLLPSGWRFAVPLLAVLLTHEFGHYFAARYHRVPASLPYFIPFPFSPFGTMGAVISMRGRIKSRDALLDIGASGPLAGMVVAIPVLVVGLMGSRIDVPTGSFYQEGQSLLYLAVKRIVLGPLQNGEDVSLNPVAFAGWTGLFITALNLIPIFQLDGGHIAYALFGPKQNRYARLLHWGLLVMFLYNAARFVGPVVVRQTWGDIGQAISNSSFWLVWFVFIHILMRLGGRDHPPTNPGELSPMRRAVAGFSLLLFVLLFMPTPFAHYGRD